MEPAQLCYVVGSAAFALLYSCKNSKQFKHDRVPVSWQSSARWREAKVWSDFVWKGLAFSICICCSPVERHFLPLPTFLRVLQSASRFCVAQATSLNTSALLRASVTGRPDAWFGSRISQAAQSIPRCVWAHGLRPVCVPVRLLPGRCHWI